MTTQSVELTIVPEIEESQALAVLSPESRLTLKQVFTPYFVEFKALKQKADLIAVNSPKAARETRLALRKVRTSAENARKKAGADALLYKKSVDGLYNLLEENLSPVEKRLDDIEHQEEIREQERLAKLKADRLAELIPFATITATDTTFYDLSHMPEAQYISLRDSLKAAADAKVLAAKKVEEERLAAEAAKEAERIRLAEENKKLAAEAAARKKALDDERKANEARIAKERAENEAKLEAERKKAAQEAARIKKAADEKAAKERAEREAKEKAEQVKRDEEAKKLAAERAKMEAVAKAERDRLAAEAEKARLEAQKLVEEAKKREDAEKAKKAKEVEEAKKAAAAPDREKLVGFAKMIRNLKQVNPKLTTEAGTKLSKTIESQIERFAAWVDGEAKKL